MMETLKEIRELKINLLLMALGTDKQQIASEIGEDRGNVINTLNGKRRALRIRRKVIAALCQRVEKLIVGDETAEEEQAKAA